MAMRDDHDTVQAWLRQGIAAVKAGQTVEAQTWLARVVAADETNVQGWLWLSSALADANARVDCLTQALAHNPEHPQLQKALNMARARQVQAWMREALQAELAGDRPRARELLMQVVAADEANVTAWWELGQVVETPEDQEVCFENVLALEPDHALARQALADIRREQEALLARESPFAADATLPDSLFVSAPDEPPTEPTDYRTPIQLEPAEIASATLFSDELMCPFCAVVTDYEDRRCGACGHLLWERGRVVPQLRPAYGLTLTFEGVTLLIAGLLPMLFVVYVTFLVEPADFNMVLQFYLGKLSDAPPSYTAALATAPAIFFWLPFIPGLLALFIFMTILTRWLPLFYAGVALAGVRLLLGVIYVFFLLLGGLGNVSASEGVFGGVALRYMQYGMGLGAALSLLFSGMSLTFLLGIQDHFEVTERRRLLQLDRDAERTAASLWMHGRLHAQAGAWALAALHLRRALIMEERLEIYLQLTVAYVNLGYLEMAERTLADAKRFSPHNPQVEALAELVAQKCAAKTV